MDAENASLKERLDDDDKYENELKGQLKEAERREADLLSKVNTYTQLIGGCSIPRRVLLNAFRTTSFM